MGLRNELNKIINKFSWLFVWNSEKRKQLRNRLTLVYGTNNVIVFFDGNCEERKNRSGLSIQIKGNNNTVKIAKSAKFNNCTLNINANNTIIYIGENSKYNFMNINLCCGNGQKVTFGNNINVFGMNIYLHEENAELIVKDSCLFSNSISIWATDGHSIFDKDTKQRINNINHPVEIGEHCWIGEGVKLSKNAKLPPNTVVGMGSVVTKEFFEENTIIAGNPAGVIKRNILWHPDLNHKFE